MNEMRSKLDIYVLGYLEQTSHGFPDSKLIGFLRVFDHRITEKTASKRLSRLESYSYIESFFDNEERKWRITLEGRDRLERWRETHGGKLFHDRS